MTEQQLLEDFALSTELFGHSQEVRSVLVLENGTIVTGSRDRTIRVWIPAAKGYELNKTLIGHEGAVASFAVVSGSPYYPGGVIASAGYDKVIHVWDLQQDTPIATLRGHEKEVCCLSTVGGRLVSGSWDWTARVWQGSECVAVLRHTNSVLGVLGLDTGDIITGTADKFIKVWRNNAEVATITGHTDVVRAIVAFDQIGFLSTSNDGTVRLWSQTGEALQTFNVSSEFIFALCVLKGYPGAFACGGEEMCARVGTVAGELKDIPHPCAIWSIASAPNGDLVTGGADGVARVWTRSQDRVVDPEHLVEYQRRTQEAVEERRNKGENGKAGTVDGVKYDVVINVDLGDGLTRKIGYNRGQNPWEVAQKFLFDHEIPQDYLDQVALFIQQNAGTTEIGPAEVAPVQYSDPYTGGTRYVPQTTQTTGQFSDPLTGGGRYIPSYSQPTAPTPSPTTTTPAFNPIPFSAAPVPSPSHQSFTSFPLQTPVPFDQVNFQLLFSKLEELNGKVAASKPEQALSAEELQAVKKITEVLAVQPPRSGSLTPADDAVLGKLLQWPSELRFPALDLLRSYVLHPDAATKWASNRTLVQSLLAAYEGSKVNAMLVFKIFSNMFKHPSFDDLLWNEQEAILEAAAGTLPMADTSQKQLRLALATLVLNYSVLLARKSKPEGRMQSLSLLSELLGNEAESEPIFRGLVALGTLIWNDEETKALVEDFALKDIIISQLSSSIAKNAKVASELKTYLKL